MSERVDEDEIGLARNDHPDTAHEAARMILPRSGTLRRRVYDYISSCGLWGATDDEIQHRLNMEGNTERPRRVELVDLDLIKDSGRRRVSRGRNRIVWVTTEQGDQE